MRSALEKKTLRSSRHIQDSYNPPKKNHDGGGGEAAPGSTHWTPLLFRRSRLIHFSPLLLLLLHMKDGGSPPSLFIDNNSKYKPAVSISENTLLLRSVRGVVQGNAMTARVALCCARKSLKNNGISSRFFFSLHRAPPAVRPSFEWCYRRTHK